MAFRDVGEGSLWLRSWRVDRGREKQESLPGRTRGEVDARPREESRWGDRARRSTGGIPARGFGVNAIP